MGDSVKSIKEKIFSVSIVIASFTLLTHFFSMFKELSVASFYGTTDSLDAYLMAILIPLFLINILTGSFSSAFIPTLVRVIKEHGTISAQEMISEIVAWSCLFLGVNAILLSLLSPIFLPVLCRGFSYEKIKLTETIFFLLLPIIILKGISNILSGIFNATEHFALPAAVTALVPFFAIVFIFSVGAVWGIYALILGTIIGFGVETFILGIAISRRGLSIKPRFCIPGPNMRIVIGQYFPMIIGAMLMGSTEIVDKSMAAALPPGSVASLNYGNKLIMVVLSLAASAIGTAVLPYFSKMVAEEDWYTMRKVLKYYLKLIFSFTIPIVTLFVFASEPLVNIIFQRGLFTSDDTRMVSSIVFFFSFQIPFYVAGIMLVRLISSFRSNHILMWGAMINLAVNIGLNILFIRLMGLKGVALSTSLVYLISFLFLILFSYKLIRRNEILLPQI